MCIEREKVDFKSREVNCLKECTLALSLTVCRTMTYINDILNYIPNNDNIRRQRNYETLEKKTIRTEIAHLSLGSVNSPLYRERVPIASQSEGP